MNSEDKFWCTMILGAFLSAIIFTAVLCYFDKSKTIGLAKLGYEKTAIVGNSYPVYQKSNCIKED